MIRKLAMWIVMLALVVQLTPSIGGQAANAAVSGNFIFPAESDDVKSPRIVTDERVTLDGTIANVDPQSISYSVFEVVSSNDGEDKYGNSRENLTSNVFVNGSKIQVYNIPLFPGVNKITFKGTQGGGEVTNSIYIEYRNSPMLYNLTASLDGFDYPIVDSGTTVVQSPTSKGRPYADISITGNAPNAQQVTIVANGASKTYTVNTANDSKFAAAPIRLNKGKNLVVFKVKNNNQVIETTREIAFYNGSVTFYDVNFNENDTNGANITSAALEFNPNINITSVQNNKFTITGTVIVPNSYHEVTDPNDPSKKIYKPHPEPNKLESLRGEIRKADGSKPPIVLAANDFKVKPVGNPAEDAPFFTYNFIIELPDNLAGYDFDARYNVELLAKNEENDHVGATPLYEGTDSLSFSLRDNSKPYIKEINYLPGYSNLKKGDKDAKKYESMTGVPLDGKSLYGMPIGLEILVAGDVDSDPIKSKVVIDNLLNQFGEKTPAVVNEHYKIMPLNHATIEKNVDGQIVTYTRYIVEIKKTPYEGTQSIEMHFEQNGESSAKKTVKFTLVFGPFVNFEKAVDNMVIYVDTTAAEEIRAEEVIAEKLGKFAGELQNISNVAEIRYGATTDGPRTVYFYINNVPFPLVAASSEDKTKFILDANVKEAYAAMFTGENLIKIVFQGKKNYYEKTVRVKLIPTNLPVIPVDAAGIYPFSYQEGNDAMIVPIPNDPKFTKQGGLYTTKESFMNVYGTFDFIDLGKNASSVEAKIEDLKKSNVADKYILKINATSWQPDGIQWNLAMPLQIWQNGEYVSTVNSGYAGQYYNDLIVRYELTTESFSFILKRQELNPDGSSSVYNFSVYNSGLYGPKATARLEVDPTVLPYKILRPILPAEGTVNKNFIDIIINAKGAEKVIINKIEAEKFEYDYNHDGVIDPEVDFPNAFRAKITGLKPGANKISFTIQSANDKVSDSIVITYVPTNIPGAQYLEGMKSSHKMFGGALTLTFPKGSTLIRRDYNVPAEFKNQIFNGHKLLFAIANPEDGVVDRREYDNPPPNFDLILQNYGNRFRVSFPTRYSKSSPVFWIDPGLADDLSRPGYDPLPYGVDPYQYPNETGPNGTRIPTYDERPDDRELVSSKRGTLTLSYDPSIRDTVGTLITVFRYDVKNKFWVNLGGVVDTKKHTITVPFDQFGYYVVGKTVYSFMDVTNHPYARNYMEAVFSKGIMNAINFDDFGADMYTSRGEFARMIVKGLELPFNYEPIPDGSNNTASAPHFDDVAPIINPDALWDYRYIETAARAGIVRGSEPRVFGPSNNLTRQEAAVMLARALNLKLETDPKKIDAGLQKLFKDYADIGYYAKAAVLAISKKGYIQGAPVDTTNPKKGYVFEPKSNLLRSDAAIIVGRMLVSEKRLPKLN
ncbi:S-layer homology domain-containing protein [Paenibacillus sp. GCM10027626]|uniref:S-layer homology domain-containing protein n=1 Tax=Paenibacillus sp. GCM10027626 TaxID=3273411 RepID=UPI0036392899